jgi:hypothetical protein
LKRSFGGPLSKLCVTPPFSINFRCQIKNQVSDYRLLGASSLNARKVHVVKFKNQASSQHGYYGSRACVSISNDLFKRILNYCTETISWLNHLILIHKVRNHNNTDQVRIWLIFNVMF